VTTIGRGNHRVVIADDFYKNPDQVVELSESLCYISGAQGSFPGKRAVVCLDTRPLIDAMSELWGSRLEPSEVYQPVVFSAIMTGSRLTNAQRQPHLDAGVTGLIYLNSDEHSSGGTALYRHRLSGLEWIPTQPNAAIVELAQRLDINPETLKTPQGYISFLDNMIFNPHFAAKGNDYINDGNEFWELLHLATMKFNRLAIIDGRIPHSQYVKQGAFTDHARLTQTIYLKPAR
jgi:hypothetical protein